MQYDFKAIEKKWQDYWEAHDIFKVDVHSLKNKFYVLNMFPYPSGDRLHIGHWYQYGIMDSWARFQKMRGKGVFNPMGFDAFGLPAENFAIKKSIHPDVSTSKNVAIMMEQFKRMGVSYDWRYALNTSKPDYYKWTQWVFLTLFENALAYKKAAPVNWCPSCQTVLANEQVIDGLCERCDSQIIRKNLKQWFFKITDYAERLLTNIDQLDWPEKTKAMQKNWIGKSAGAEIKFAVANHNKSFQVFTTRPDTLFGVTYVVLAPEHPLVNEITTKEHTASIKKYCEQTKKISEIERLSTEKQKTGVFTGSYAINPINQEKVPIWIADYVLYSYGTGAVMAVPAHDERDFEFAKNYNLPVKNVILKPGTPENAQLDTAFTEEGTVINSGSYNGMNSVKMIPAIINDLEKNGFGNRKVQYRLRDWLVSRQRYWGCPIPIVYCESCGEVAVPIKQLPVLLPENVDFKPTGESPLRRSKEFMNTSCPKCNRPAQREADTLDTFVCSSWYFLRFPNVGDNNQAFASELTNKILPVDRYVGGAEHACMHLLYARFINMVFHDLKLINFEEPFPHLTHQGLVLGPDGQKMSKSRGNTVSPDPYVEEHGSDILRLYLLFGFNYVDGGPWDDGGFKAVVRFSERLSRLFEQNLDLMKHSPGLRHDISAHDKKLLYRLHYTIKMVTQDTEKFQFNTSIARLMELYNDVHDYLHDTAIQPHNNALLHQILNTMLILLAPFAPHFAEEWWQRSGHNQSIFYSSWPNYDERFLERDEIKLAIMINGKLRAEIQVPKNADEAQIKELALRHDKISKYVEKQTIVKSIFVPHKLINLIVK